MNVFVTWEMLKDFATLVTVVLVITQFSKDIKFIKKIPTKYWSMLIALALILLTNINSKTFDWFDLILYLASSIFISCSANGIYDFPNKQPVKEEGKG